MAWDQALHRGKKEKEIGVWAEKKFASEPSQKVVRRGKRVNPFPGQYFSYMTLLFAFLPHCGAWSQATSKLPY